MGDRPEQKKPQHIKVTVSDNLGAPPRSTSWQIAKNVFPWDWFRVEGLTLAVGALGTFAVLNSPYLSVYVLGWLLIFVLCLGTLVIRWACLYENEIGKPSDTCGITKLVAILFMAGFGIVILLRGTWLLSRIEVEQQMTAVTASSPMPTLSPSPSSSTLAPVREDPSKPIEINACEVGPSVGDKCYTPTDKFLKSPNAQIFIDANIWFVNDDGDASVTPHCATSFKDAADSATIARVNGELKAVILANALGATPNPNNSPEPMAPHAQRFTTCVSQIISRDEFLLFTNQGATYFFDLVLIYDNDALGRKYRQFCHYTYGGAVHDC